MPPARAAHQEPEQMMFPVCRSHVVVRVTVGIPLGTVYRLIPVMVSSLGVAHRHRLSSFCDNGVWANSAKYLVGSGQHTCPRTRVCPGEQCVPAVWKCTLPRKACPVGLGACVGPHSTQPSPAPGVGSPWVQETHVCCLVDCSKSSLIQSR